jgi:hypothetical protein
LANLKEDLIDLIRYGAKTKTDFECGWPMLYAYKLIKEKNIFSGFGADGHFCISKKGMIHFKNKIERDIIIFALNEHHFDFTHA